MFVYNQLVISIHSGGAVAQSVERATPGEEVLGSIPAVTTRSLLDGSVSVKCDRLRQKSWSPRSVSCVTREAFLVRGALLFIDSTRIKIYGDLI